MSAFIIQFSEALGVSATLRCARAALLVLTFLLSMGANCGQAPAELCLNGSDCDDDWLTYISTSPASDEIEVSDQVLGSKLYIAVYTLHKFHIYSCYFYTA